jgi:protein-S-isoprenylcysteine O-methyltransferase Ste14
MSETPEQGLSRVSETLLVTLYLWALIPAFIIVALYIYRTAREDRTLREELEGYAEYAKKVRYRLLPGVW